MPRGSIAASSRSSYAGCVEDEEEGAEAVGGRGGGADAWGLSSLIDEEESGEGGSDGAAYAALIPQSQNGPGTAYVSLLPQEAQNGGARQYRGHAGEETCVHWGVCQ